MSEWRQVQLGQIADVRVSNVDKKTLPGEQSVQLCNYMDVYSNDYIRGDLTFMTASATSAEIARFKVECGDVLITKDSETPDDIGIPAVVINEIDNLVCGYHVALIKPNKSFVDSVYLSKQLGRAETAGYFARYAAGSTRYGLPMGAMTRTPIALPPLAQQQKIAAILTSIDTAIEQTEALIAKYQHIKAGLMHDLFTRGVLPNGQLRPPREQSPELYQETAIGWIPRDWSTCQIQDCGEVKLGRQRSPDQHSGKWTTPYLRVANVFDGFIDFSDVLEMDFTPHERKLFGLINGDILLNEGQSLELVGRNSIYRGEPEKYCFQNTLVRFRCKSEHTPEFFAHLFKLLLDSGSFQRIAKQTTSVAHLGADRFARMSCPKVAFGEQRLIANRLNVIDTRIAKTDAQLLKLKKQKLGLMQDLLTGKVAVKVGAEAPEPANG